MSISANGLPESVLDWLQSTFEGEISLLERSVSRREGWLVDIDRAGGAPVQGFLRLERFVNGEVVQPHNHVDWETQVLQTLQDSSVKVPAVLAHSETLKATLFERSPGRDDVHQVKDASLRSKISHDFMHQLALLHDLPLDQSARDALQAGATASGVGQDSVISDVQQLESQYRASTDVPEPLAALTFEWLYRNAPEWPEHPVLLQGDTGPGNFLFVDDEVSAIIDWEQAHLGDPMEDIGHIFCRAFFHPWGDTNALLEVYKTHINRPYDAEKLDFYRVASFAKAALASRVVVNTFNCDGSLPISIYYAAAGEYGLANALATACGIEVPPVELPEPKRSGLPDWELPVQTLASHIIETELLPQIEDPYLQSRARDLRQIAIYQAHREAYRVPVLEQEARELSDLLGKPIIDPAEGIEQLCAMIAEWDERAIPEIVAYLNRRAQRSMALSKPLSEVFFE